MGSGGGLDPQRGGLPPSAGRGLWQLSVTVPIAIQAAIGALGAGGLGGREHRPLGFSKDYFLGMGENSLGGHHSSRCLPASEAPATPLPTIPGVWDPKSCPLPRPLLSLPRILSALYLQGSPLPTYLALCRRGQLPPSPAAGGREERLRPSGQAAPSLPSHRGWARWPWGSLPTLQSHDSFLGIQSKEQGRLSSSRQELRTSFPQAAGRGIDSGQLS
ncbi:Hypothetical predicted protein [Podarcis lilfordi]|uniref:Uncharacterized protein n=1 Tax=Podarcis lilfordi TaxID=74358 RepID=A0AA35KBC1_9SAUR|nr:Hypothetical predicted protein [Podarcis lilfordi]